MSHADKEYIELVRSILEGGEVREDRTGTGTVSRFGTRMEFYLQEGFPLLTTKKVNLRIIFEELKWFLSGSTDLKWLLDRNVNIWNQDGYRFYKEQGGTKPYDEFIEMVREEGFDLGPIYGHNLREWRGSGEEEIDQVKHLIEGIRNNPTSRRHVVTTWNPTVLSKIALPSCHGLPIQFYVSKGGNLDCQVYIRSNDVFLGNPFNVASYALLTHLIAKMTDLNVGRLTIIGGDSHIYLNHVDAIKKQIAREPRESPKLRIKTKKDNIEDYNFEDIELIGYDPHGPIKADLSVGL